jgi:alpha 1,2-mannosyltransferase
MAIAALLRPTKITTVLIGIVFIYLASLMWTPHWSSRVSSPGQQPVDSAHVPAQIAKPSPGTKPELVKDAHKLPTADSFLPHLKAVTTMNGMTMAEAKSGCTWPDMKKVNFQYGADVDWAKQDRNDTELEFRRKQWHDFIDNDLIPYTPYEDRFKGRGIVIVAGNQESMKRVQVILHALKRLKSRMAIEIHYWDDEMIFLRRQTF